MLSLATTPLLCLVLAAPSVDELLSRSQVAAAEGKLEQARNLATEAIETDPKNFAAYMVRALLYSRIQQPALAVKDLDQVIKLAPQRAEAYDLRGSEQFKQGKIAESITDFDAYVKLLPAQGPFHWKRGISYYYAGRYEEGRKQFERYQLVDDNDVENAVWRYLCMARSVGVEKARRDILHIKDDRRVPMMQVYALFAGQAKPDDVLEAARAGNPDPRTLHERLFYAHLYLGLHYEVNGDPKQAREHIEQAEKRRIGHYMWDVAHVHAELLRAKDVKQP